MTEVEPNIDNYLDNHYIQKSNWLRAAVLGANDGILSTASIAIGVASASDNSETIVLATLAGLIAGALSMAAGEYVSVSSQTDIQQSDIEREKKELAEMPEAELKLLAAIYEKRGLKKQTAKIVAKELTEHDALAAHVPVRPARLVLDAVRLHNVKQLRPHLADLLERLGVQKVLGAPVATVPALFPHLVNVEQRQVVRLGHHELFARLVRVVLAPARAVEDGRHAERRHNGEDFVGALEVFGKQEHLGQRRVQRELCAPVQGVGVVFDVGDGSVMEAYACVRTGYKRR